MLFTVKLSAKILKPGFSVSYLRPLVLHLNPCGADILANQRQDCFATAYAYCLKVLRFISFCHRFDGSRITPPRLADMFNLIFIRLHVKLLLNYKVEPKMVRENLV